MGFVATQASQVGCTKQFSEAAAPAPSSGGARRKGGHVLWRPLLGAVAGAKTRILSPSPSMVVWSTHPCVLGGGGSKVCDDCH